MTTTRDRNLQFRGIFSTGFLNFSSGLSSFFSRFSVCLVRKLAQNVKKIAEFPGGEKDVVTSLAVTVFSVPN